MANIAKIEGIGTKYAEKLNMAGIKTVEALLAKGASRKGRKDLAERTDISEALVLEWVNRADLFRIKGIGEEFSDLLEAAGVDTVKELAQRKPDNLMLKLVEVNEQKKLVRRMPYPAAVADWVKQAKELPRVVEY
jgi:predicted flap endonuclease-1-like 5' DNA nuclease